MCTCDCGSSRGSPQAASRYPPCTHGAVGIKSVPGRIAMKRDFWKAVLILATLGLTACSSEPAKTSATSTDSGAAKQAPAGPPAPIAAKAAFWEMYTPGHAWAADLLPISLKSGEV